MKNQSHLFCPGGHQNEQVDPGHSWDGIQTGREEREECQEHQNNVGAVQAAGLSLGGQDTGSGRSLGPEQHIDCSLEMLQ